MVSKKFPKVKGKLVVSGGKSKFYGSNGMYCIEWHTEDHRDLVAEVTEKWMADAIKREFAARNKKGK